MIDRLIEMVARSIARDIIETARSSGDDPIAWVTGNQYMPPLREFSHAEAVWQKGTPDNWEYLTLLIEKLLGEASVALESPEYDNALYAVDLSRFEFADNDGAKTLQEEWRMK